MNTNKLLTRERPKTEQAHERSYLSSLLSLASDRVINSSSSQILATLYLVACIASSLFSLQIFARFFPDTK